MYMCVCVRLKEGEKLQRRRRRRRNILGGGIFIERVGGERKEGRGSGEATASVSVYEIAKYHK